MMMGPMSALPRQREGRQPDVLLFMWNGAGSNAMRSWSLTQRSAQGCFSFSVTSCSKVINLQASNRGDSKGGASLPEASSLTRLVLH